MKSKPEYQHTDQLKEIGSGTLSILLMKNKPEYQHTDQLKEIGSGSLSIILMKNKPEYQHTDQLYKRNRKGKLEHHTDEEQTGVSTH